MSDRKENPSTQATPNVITPQLADHAVAIEGRMMTPIDAALLEYGKQRIIKSVETSVEFHKSMLTVSGSFGNLITTITPIILMIDKTKVIPKSDWFLFVVPPILMLLSSVIFAMGYFPQHRELMANDLTRIREARDEAIKSRKVLAFIGLGLFSSSLLLLMVFAIAIRRRIG